MKDMLSSTNKKGQTYCMSPVTSLEASAAPSYPACEYHNRRGGKVHPCQRLKMQEYRRHSCHSSRAGTKWIIAATTPSTGDPWEQFASSVYMSSVGFKVL